MSKKMLLIIIVIIALMMSACEAVIEPDSGLGVYNADEKDDQPPVAARDNISMIFYDDRDINPITSEQSANHELLKLVYSPLIRMNSAFEPVCILAQSFEQSDSEITITLKDNLKFSDGSPLTASDAVESFKAAKQAKNSPYNTQLAAFSKFSAKNDKIFVATLSYTNVDAAALLDVPIMKGGSNLIGCGPYVFEDQYGELTLKARSDYFEPATIAKISLVRPTDDTAAQNMFSLGTLDIIPTSGSMDFSFAVTRDYELVSFPSLNFLFIGINCQNPKLTDSALRRLLSQTLNREKITTSTMIGRANSTTWPFSPLWYRMKDTAGVLSQGIPEGTLSSHLNLEILVPSNSNVKEEIAKVALESFAPLGITLTITVLDYEQYLERIDQKDYELYLGETRIPKNMDSTYLFETGGTLNKHNFESEALDNDYDRYRRGDISISEYLSSWDRHTPIIPILFSKSTLFSAKDITGFTDQTPFSIYGNISTLKTK